MEGIASRIQPVIGQLLHNNEEIANHKTMPIDGMGRDVGLLREQWTLPSDHLPIGISLTGTVPVNIVSWNVLNNEYMKNVINDTSGLNKSMLTTENTIINSDGLTERDQHVINLIVTEMIGHKQCPKDVIALQECGPAFFAHLKKMLPSHMAVIFKTENERDQSIMIYNTERFELRSSEVLTGLYSDRPFRNIINILLQEKESEKLYRCLTTHLPWIPNGPAAGELANYLQGQLTNNSQDQETTILMGDLNKTEIAIASSFREAGLNNFQQISPYCTYIPYLSGGTYTRSACFDHFFILANNHGPVDSSSPDEVLDGLSILANKLQ